MRKRFIVIMMAILLLHVACQKEISSIDGTPGSGTGNIPGRGADIKRIQQGINPDLSHDTIWLITYTSSKKISKIEDSVYDYGATAKYDASDRLVEVNMMSGDYARYTYDAAGLLTQVDYHLVGTKEKFVIEYTGSNISRTTFFSDFGNGGALEPKGYETYTVAGGNITEVKQFSTSGMLTDQITLLYGTEANPFKNLSLFNFFNRFGMDQIANFYTYFNKNISSGAKIGPVTFKTNNTFTNQKLSKITSEFWYGTGGIFTYFFSY
ncbi:RHS repeat domain-containing protein [Flavitalea antarctica]